MSLYGFFRTAEKVRTRQSGVCHRPVRGDHYILRLMEIRGYDGKDSELKRQAQRFALPREQTVEDEAMSDIFNELFYNA